MHDRFATTAQKSTSDKHFWLFDVPGTSSVLESLVKPLQRNVPRAILRRILLGVFQSDGHHIDQAVQVPAVQANGTFALLTFYAGVETEGLHHLPGMPLQLGEFLAVDQHPYPDISGSYYHFLLGLTSRFSGAFIAYAETDCWAIPSLFMGGDNVVTAPVAFNFHHSVVLELDLILSIHAGRPVF